MDGAMRSGVETTEHIVYCYPNGNDFKLIALDFGFAVYCNDFITVSIIQKMFYSLMAIALGLWFIFMASFIGKNASGHVRISAIDASLALSYSALNFMDKK